MIEIFTLPFMQRAILGGILVSILASLVGVLAVLKRSSFFGDTIAHASLAGVALGLLFGLDPILTAAVLVTVIALLLPQLETKSRLPLDNLLGFVLPFSMAIGVIVLTFIHGYQPELISYLFGNILSISWSALLIIGIVTLTVLLIFFIYKDQLILTIFDSDQAKLSNIKTQLMETLYSILLALTIVVSIRIVGIILINAMLVIPAIIARIFARSLKEMFFLTPLIGISATLVGLGVSYFANLPSGPMVTVVAGLFFVFVVLLKKK